MEESFSGPILSTILNVYEVTDENCENRSARDLFLEPQEYEADPVYHEKLINLHTVVSLACQFSSQQQHAFIDVMAKVQISLL